MPLRLDRTATLMLFHPLARVTQRPCTSILMYHAVSDQDEPLSPYFVTNTKPAVFRAQMRFLAENGYRVVDLETALREKATDDRRVVLTFDDGFRDFYTHAFPVLREFGFTATMFVPTGLIGECGSVPSPHRGLELLGKERKEFAEGEGSEEPRAWEKHESLDKGEVHPTSANVGVASALCAENFPRPSDGRGIKGEGNPVSAQLSVENQSEMTREKSNFPRPSDGRGIKGEGNSGSPRSQAESDPSSTIHHPSIPRAGRECMTWDEIRELADNGIHFGSHTVSHPKLHGLKWSKIEEELSQSKKHLEQELNREITTFAYPFAYPQADNDFTSRFESLLKQLGYRCNVTTRIGRAENGDDPFSLRRLPMNTFDDNTLLQAKLAGGYDWLAVPQAVTKQVKRWIT